MGIAQGMRQYEESCLRSINFSDVLMQGMVSLLLFAAALNIDLGQLKTYLSMAIFSTGRPFAACPIEGLRKPIRFLGLCPREQEMVIKSESPQRGWRTRDLPPRRR